MSNRQTEGSMAWAAGFMAVVVLVSLVVLSGALPWAILGGAAAAAVVFWLTRAWDYAFSAGFATALLILVLGIASWLSPGWYQGLF